MLKNIKKHFKLLAVFLCSSLFLYLWHNYSSSNTTVHKSYNIAIPQSVQLPSIIDIKQVIVISNDLEQNENTNSVLKELDSVNNSYVIVRFGDLVHMDWFVGRTDVAFFMHDKQCNCYHGLSKAQQALEGKTQPIIYGLHTETPTEASNDVSKVILVHQNTESGSCWDNYGLMCPTPETCALCHIMKEYSSAGLILLGFKLMDTERLFWYHMQQHYKIRNSEDKTILCPFVPPVSENIDTGWYKSSEVIAKHYAFDPGFGAQLVKFLDNKNTIDIGCGIGQLGHYIIEHNANVRWSGFDGGNNVADVYGMKIGIRHDAAFQLPAVCWMDASQPVKMLIQYDWTICIEVGEHIPKEQEGVFIDNLIKLSKEGVIVSWARPKQPGLMHVNPQPNSYIIEQMEKRGLRYDEQQSMAFRDSVLILWWLRNTIMVFYKS